MEHKFDIVSMIKACNYMVCEIKASTDGEDYYEIKDENSLLYNLDKSGIGQVEETYTGVIWTFSDNIDDKIETFEVQYDIKTDYVSFRFDSLSLKTKYTLINILKSQHDWQYVGYSLYDIESEEITDDMFFHKYISARDAWLNVFETACNKYIVDCVYADLYKGEEEVEGEKIDVLELVLEHK